MAVPFDTYNFTDDFQDLILACLIRYPEKFVGIGQVVRPAFFNGPVPIEVAQHVLAYRKKYDKYPTFTVLANYAFSKASRINPKHGKDIVDYVSRLAQLDTSDWKAVLDVSIEFAKERAVFEGLRTIHQAQTENKMDKVNAVHIMEKALSIGTSYDDLGISLYHDSGKAIDMLTARSYGVMTGYAALDKIWKFGWGPGWLIVPLAPPKRFKSGFCVNLAMNMSVHSQVDVLYYACELSQELAMMRAIYNMTGFTEQDIWNSPEIYKQKVAEVLKQKMYGNVWFKGFASKSVTIDDIEAHAKHVIQVYGLQPKAIFIDYAETIKPIVVDKTTPDWRQQADIYVQARALGTKLGCCVIMPDRCNKDTVDRKVPSMKSFQGSFEKAGAVDIALGLCATEEEHLQNTLRYFVFLNRHGPALKHFQGRVEPSLMRMTIDREIDYDPEAEEEEEKKKKQRHAVRKSTAALDFDKTQAS